MNKEKIIFAASFIISFLILVALIFVIHHKGIKLLLFLILCYMNYFVYKLRARSSELVHGNEEMEIIKSQLHDMKLKVDEKTKMLADKIAESNIQRRITEAMTSTVEISQVLHIILEAVVNTLHHDRAVLFLINGTRQFLEAHQGVGLPEHTLNHARIQIDTPNHNPFAQSIKEARPIIISNASRYRHLVSFLAGEQGEFPDSIVTMPLVAKDVVVGLVLIDHLNTKRAFEEDDLRTLLSYTQQAGMAILNARLYETEKKFHVQLNIEIEKAKKELLDTQSQLIQSERLAALGEMAAVVAHEVKNPMASIRACTQTMEQSMKHDEHINPKYLYYIRKEIDRLDKIVRSILAYSRPPTARMVSFDLNALVEETLDFMKKEFKNEKIKLEQSLNKNIPRIMIDPEQTKQILLNLLDNSLHFLKNREVKRLVVKTYTDNNTVVLSVEDTGGGIEPTVVPRIFEPFFTTKTQGTGLGLAISKRIIESQNGAIAVHNMPGVGLRMDIIFKGTQFS